MIAGPQRADSDQQQADRIRVVPGIYIGGLDGPRIEVIPGAKTVLTLPMAIKAALESNAGLLAETERRGELRGQMSQARATGLPTIDATSTWQRGRDPSMALDQTFGGGSDGSSPFDSLFGGISIIPLAEDIPAQTFWRSSVNARWEINPGLIINAVGAAGLGIERQEAEITNVTNRGTEQVITGYYTVITAGANYRALRADILARTEFLNVTRHRLTLGLATGLDTLRARVSLANLTPQLRSAYQRLFDAGAQLNVLMGLAPLTPMTIDKRIEIETDPVDPDLSADHVAYRPDIQSLKLLIEIMRKNRGAQKSAHRPYLSANASYGYVGKDFSSQTDNGHDFWSASVTLTLPVFDGLLTKGQVQETDASIRRMEYDYEDAIRNARLEIRSLIGDLEAARNNLIAAKLNMTAAEDAAGQIGLRYELGKSEYLSVLSSQSDCYLANSNYIQARHDVLTLTASLKRALGFSPSSALSTINKSLTSAKKSTSDSTDSGRR